MSIFTTLYDGLKDNERIKDLGFGILGGVISIVGTRYLLPEEKDETQEDFEDGIEDD
tara:strand:- start:44 stop:214 length:171 start_codon:yes stop_codon:yes gene_type:complete